MSVMAGAASHGSEFKAALCRCCASACEGPAAERAHGSALTGPRNSPKPPPPPDAAAGPQRIFGRFLVVGARPVIPRPVSAVEAAVHS